MSDNCSHNEIEPYGDGSWGRCKLCGDDSFPLTAEAAGMCSYCGAYCGYHKRGCPLEEDNGPKAKAWEAFLAGFKVSGEGSNYEHPYCDHRETPEDDPEFVQKFEDWWKGAQ